MAARAGGAGSASGNPAPASGFPAPTAPASPGLLPLTGVSTRVGDLRAYLADAFGEPIAPGVTEPAWRVTPSAQISETFTDAVPTRSGGRAADLITGLNPGVTVVGDTNRLKVNLDYSPEYDIYAFTSGQNRLNQNLEADGSAALVPGQVFVRAQALITQFSRYGTAAAQGTTVLPSQDQTQATAFAVTPYLSHSFGANGTLQLGASYLYSATSTPAGATTGDFASTAALPGNYGNASVSTTREFLYYVTGENLGRFQDSVQIDAYQSTGTGVLQGARRLLAADDVAYAVTRTIALLGELGYEEVHYAGITPVRIDDAVWAIGTRLDPNPDSRIVLQYRHRDGINSAYVDATYQVTARLRLFGTYSDALATTQEELQGALLLSNLDQTGNPLESTSNAPLLFGSSFFGLETDLYRVKRLSATAAWLLDRDVLAASIERESRTLVATTSPATAQPSDKGTIGMLSWTHELGPLLSSTLMADYGTRTPIGGGSEGLWGVTASLTKRFTPTLTGSAQYSFNSRASDFQGRGFSENMFVVALQKQF